MRATHKKVISRPVIITDAERSHDDQLRSRQIRYLIMMSIRAVCRRRSSTSWSC